MIMNSELVDALENVLKFAEKKAKYAGLGGNRNEEVLESVQTLRNYLETFNFD